jgi:hypothetical protein
MTISQLTVNDRLKEGREGQLYDADPRLIQTDAYSFGGARTPESTVVDLAGAAANSTLYSFYVGDELIEYTSDGTATETEIHAGLAAAFNANPVARGLATAVATATEVTITANRSGIDLGIEAADALLTVAITAADAGDPLPFGRVVVADGEGVKLPVGASTAAQIVGISKLTYDEYSNIVGNAAQEGYRQGTSAEILETGRIFVAGAQASAATKTSAVWVGTDVGEQGKLFTADNGGTTRVQVTDGSLKWYKANVIQITRGL